MPHPRRIELISSELAHEPGPEPDWQESLVLLWGDPDRGLGGFHRLGHEVNQGRGELWCGVLTPGHRFRRDERVALLPTDRSVPVFGLDTHTFTLDPDGRMRLRITEPDLDLDLIADDFAPMTSVYPPERLESVGHGTVRDHLETHGRVRGRLTLAGHTHEIDAFCVRDHSWGPRDWSLIVSHRWVIGSLGPDLSFSATVMQGTDGRFLSQGTLWRDGRGLAATGIDIVVFQESDGLSHRGGRLRMWLADGSEFSLEIETVDGWFFNAHSHIEVDTVCHARTPDGRTGYCDLGVSNGRRVTEPLFGIRAATHDGVRPRPAEGRRHVNV
ncbi:DUF7065 domain-containing protein [Crossiella cryophila]|uniref:Uncharacterized protein n=1 Tax=Crossiella cryophila TaxID=43355 RepID=A0A7W7CEF4_9PSEU|nr:propanediol utilization protein [Crossiella cryophila]MBB4679677.1 hypothetical protein [Crossiella cryophila]